MMKKKKSFKKRFKDTSPREQFAVLLFLAVLSTLLFFAYKYWPDIFIFNNAKHPVGRIIGFVIWVPFFGTAFAVLTGTIVHIIYYWYDFFKKFK